MSKKRKTLLVFGLLLIALGVGYLSYAVVSGIRARKDAETLHSIAFQDSTVSTQTP